MGFGFLISDRSGGIFQLSLADGGTLTVLAQPGSITPPGGAGVLIFPTIVPALEAFDVAANATQVGQLAVVQSNNSLWEYTLAGEELPVDNITVASATGAALGRWQRTTSLAAQQYKAETAWHVNGATGNDENDGLTAGTALQTVSELVRRWGPTPKLAPTGVIVTIHGNCLTTDVYQDVIPAIGAGGNLTFQGVQTVSQTFTLGTFTPANFAAGTKATITAAGQPAGFFSTLVGAYILDTTQGAYFYIDADLGTATASITQARITPDSFPGTYATPVDGDTLQVMGQPIMFVVDPTISGAQGIGVGVNFRNLIIECPTFALTPGIGGSFFECQFASTILLVTAPFANAVNLIGCYFADFFGGPSYIGNATVVAGSISPAAGTTLTNGSSLDGDVLVNFRIHYDVGFVFLARVYWGETNDTDVGAAPQFQLGASNYGTSRLWGPGGFNAAHGMTFFNFSGASAVSTLLLTGALTLDGGATGFHFNNTTGVYTAPAVAVTAANIDVGSLTDPATGSRYANAA